MTQQDWNFLQSLIDTNYISAEDDSVLDRSDISDYISLRLKYNVTGKLCRNAVWKCFSGHFIV